MLKVTKNLKSAAQSATANGYQYLVIGRKVDGSAGSAIFMTEKIAKRAVGSHVEWSYLSPKSPTAIFKANQYSFYRYIGYHAMFRTWRTGAWPKEGDYGYE